VRLTKKRYENGLATMLELLTAQAQQDKANADLISARYEQVVQRAEWMRLLGRLTPEQIDPPTRPAPTKAAVSVS
jgi:outer membrane protein TolC